jgi:phosphatidylglycerol lysyltransferase
MVPMVDPPPAEWRRWVLPCLTLLIVIAVLFVIRRELAHFRLHEVAAQLRSIPSRRVLGATALTIVSYLLLGGYDLLGLKYVARRLPYARVAFTSFVAYSIGHNLGLAAFTGGAIRYRVYSAAGLSAVEVATLQAFCSLTTGLGLAVLAGISLVITPQRLATLMHLPHPLAVAIGAALLAFVAAYALWCGAGRGVLEFRGWSLRPPRLGLSVAQIALGAVDLAFSGAVLWVVLPAPLHIPFLSFVGAYAVAIVAGILSHLPGGIGVFESVILLALPRAEPNALLGSLLAYRAIYYFLPLLIAAVIFGVKELNAQRQALARVERVAADWIAPITPQVTGALVFAAGTLLLVSGSVPMLDARLLALRRVVPLPILELSHLAGSVAGLGLLILARALYGRVREGYTLTVWLLLAGVAASLLKGIAYEEALVLLLVLLVLWLGRRAFYRPSAVLGEPFTPAWLVSISAVLGAAIWIGFLAHRHVEYSNDLWWTFELSGSAPRMLRASLAVVLLAATFFALNMLRPKRPEPVNASSADLERARACLAQGEGTLGNVAFTGDKRLLFDERDEAFIMYQVAGRSWIALGDPVGARRAHEELVWRFREMSDLHGGLTVFYQVSGDRLPLYVDLGLVPVKIGEEARVALAGFSLEGAARSELRQVRRRAEREGSSFEVLMPGTLDPLLPALRAISDGWLAEKSTAEKGFSVGFFDENYVRRFPVAIVRREGRPVAFANLWTSAACAEVSVDLMRFGADAPRAVMDFLFVELMLWARAAGYQWFSLGMAPLAGLERHPLAPAWHRVGNFVFRHGEHFYNFDGLRRYKSKFSPVWEPKYLVSPGGFALPRILMDVSVLIAGGFRELISK